MLKARRQRDRRSFAVCRRPTAKIAFQQIQAVAAACTGAVGAGRIDEEAVLAIAGGLELKEFGVAIVEGQELNVATLFEDFALFED